MSNAFEYERPWLAEYQREALFGEERYGVVEGSTKCGKTAPCLIWLAEQCMFGGEGQNHWWVAPVYPQAEIAYKRMKRGLPHDIIKTHDTDKWIELPGGRRMWFKTAEKPNNLYGEDVYSAVIDEASRCFVAGTLVATPTGYRPIETISVGDQVLNAAGVGTVQRTIRKKGDEIAVVMVQECYMVSSADHRYFTQRGWVEARHLGPDDILIRQDESVRLLRGGFHPAPRKAQSALLLESLPAGRDQGRSNSILRDLRHNFRAAGQSPQRAFLRDVLLAEMENDPAGDPGEGAWTRNKGQGSSRSQALLAERGSGVRQPQKGARRSKCDERSRRPRAGVSFAESEGASSARPRGEWCAIDGSAVLVVGAARGRLCCGVVCSHWGEAFEGRPTNPLSSRYRISRGQGGYRDRRSIASNAVSRGIGRAQRCDVAGARVERVEVYQSGSDGFRRYGGSDNSIDLYDLTVSGHPSFSVNGFLVHNCREESWHAVRSTLTATRGPIRIIGNVKGRKNWAFALARKAEAGAPGMTYKRITAFDAIQAGILSQDEIDQARSDLPEAVFRELYLAEPSDDGGNPFGMKAIADCIGPMSDGKPIAWGWDLAKSVDWTVGIALDAEGRICRFERFQKPWNDTMDRIVEVTGSVPALVDSTGVGDPILEMLQKRSGSRFEGFKFTSESKQRIMEGLAVAIQKMEIAIPEGPIRSELENFEYEYTRTGVRYTAPDGFHDDCVCALALAVSHKAHARQPLTIDPELRRLAKMPRRGGFTFNLGT